MKALGNVAKDRPAARTVLSRHEPQPSRDKRAAERLTRKLLRKQGFAPKRAVTDKLPSYAAEFRELRLSCRHEQGQARPRAGFS